MSTVALGLAVFADMGLDEALGRVVKAGYSSIDLQIDSVFEIGRDPRLHERAGAAGLRSELDALGLSVVCVSNVKDCQLLLGPHGPHTDVVLAGDIETKRAHARAAARAAVDLAVDLGAPFVRFFFGCPDFGRWFPWPGTDLSWEDNIGELVEQAGPLLEHAVASGVVPLLEPHPKQVVYDLSSALALQRRLAAEGLSLGWCIDPANVRAAGHDPVGFLRRIEPVPSVVHVKDVEVWPHAEAPEAPGWVSYGPHPKIRFRSLGWGGLDWQAICSVLAERGFEGPFVVEHEDLLLPREQGIVDARERFERLQVLAPPTKRWW